MGGGYFDYYTGNTVVQNVTFRNNSCFTGKGGDYLAKLVEKALYKGNSYSNSGAKSAGQINLEITKGTFKFEDCIFTNTN